MKKTIKFLCWGFFVLIFSWLLVFGYAYWLGCRFVKLEPQRIEGCLLEYIKFRKSKNQDILQQNLEKLGVSKNQFEQIIDRFIYYRMSQSSLDQAKKLLKMFEDRFRFVPTGTIFTAETPSYSFRMDAEVVSVMQTRPELVKEAFGS
ncbi:hypothetical protein HYY75_10295 [bacterium]|nr:hypothetical protein [bacterium]